MSGLRLGGVLEVLGRGDIATLVVVILRRVLRVLRGRRNFAALVVVILGRRGELRRDIATLVMRQGNIGGTLQPVVLKAIWVLKTSVCQRIGNQRCRIYVRGAGGAADTSPATIKVERTADTFMLASWGWLL